MQITASLRNFLKTGVIVKSITLTLTYSLIALVYAYRYSRIADVPLTDVAKQLDWKKTTHEYHTS